jgi:hypothetical protein
MQRLLPPLRRRLSTSANLSSADDALLNPAFLELASEIPSSAAPPSHRRRDSHASPFPEETIIPYTPSTTLETLQPYIPSTAMTPAGLSSALYRETARIRRNSEKWMTLSKWRNYDRKRVLISKGVVDGGYKVSAKIEELEKGTVVGEARRLMMRNGTAGTKSKRLVVAGVEEKVKGLKVPELEGVIRERKSIKA